MAQALLNMATNDSSPEKCREARRRRIEMRRLSALAGSASPPAGSASRSEKRRSRSDRPEEERQSRRARSRSTSPSPSIVASEESPAVPSTSGQAPPLLLPPIFGSMSIAGRSREMEDAISLRPDFFRPEVPGRRPLHFFAVFDGHGGSHVATLCKERMHGLLAEEMEAEGEEDCSEEGWRAAIGRCFGRMDELALSACGCGRAVGVPCCNCERAGVTSEFVGSTAVLAVVSSTCIVVANCGDSRAVLSRAGRAIPLSNDHKPDQPDELRRIEAAGGRVIYLSGARVAGILAMSRALALLLLWSHC